MAQSYRRIRTRSRSRALEEFARRYNRNSPVRSIIPYVSLDRFEPYWARESRLEIARKRRSVTASTNESAAKKPKTTENNENCGTGSKNELVPFVSAERCDVCIRNDLDNLNDGIHISHVPMEILSEIFRLLPCQDRNNARLACRYWYDACNTLSISNAQKMACPKAKSLVSFMTTLEKSRQKSLNVEFRCTSFQSCRKSFWSRVGGRVKALQFVDCELNKDIIACMGKHCSKLQHLAWEYRSPCEKSPFHVDVNHLYPKLISKTPFLNFLTSLHIHIWNVRHVINMTEDNFLMGVLRKYPNLRSLYVKLLPGRAGSIQLPFHETLFKQLLNSRLETLTFVRGRLSLEGDIPNIDHLPANYTLRELRFSVWKCDSKVQSYFVQKFLGLKHLEFCDIYGNEVLQDIWKYQTGLTSIILNWIQCSDHGFSGEVNELSDELDAYDRFARTSKDLGYCVSRLSKLEKMKIILVEKPDKLTQNVVSYFIFPNLRCLDISLWTTNMQFTLKFLQHLSNFTNLEELHVHYDKPVPYYPWMKALRNLKKLRDVFIEENYTHGFGDRQYKRFFASLPQLKRLEHRFIRTQVRWTRDSVHEEPKKIVFSPDCL